MKTSVNEFYLIPVQVKYGKVCITCRMEIISEMSTSAIVSTASRGREGRENRSSNAKLNPVTSKENRTSSQNKNASPQNGEKRCNSFYMQNNSILVLYATAFNQSYGGPKGLEQIKNYVRI